MPIATVTYPLDSAIFGPAFSEPRIREALGDEAYVRAMIRFEVELARVQGELGVVPRDAAARIARVAAGLRPGFEVLSRGVLRDGVPSIALVEALREAVGEDASYVHCGATSQDLMDTAMVCCLSVALGVVQELLDQLVDGLVDWADRHRTTVMAARTHGQQAVVTCFGLKAAVWAEPLLRHRQRLRELSPRLLRLQLGGAGGTLLAFGPRALEVVERLALALGLEPPGLPWHVQRDALLELGAVSTMICTSLGKLASDVIGLAQTEVGEVAEAAPGLRGGSSSMPHKNNPMRSEQILAVAHVASGHLAALATSGVQEHERATHGWQVEWLSLSPLVRLMGGALSNAKALLEGLVVFPERMRQNLAAGHDLTLSEACLSALSPLMGALDARRVVRAASLRARQERRSLVELLPQELARDAAGQRLEMHRFEMPSPDTALGAAHALIDDFIARARAR